MAHITLRTDIDEKQRKQERDAAETITQDIRQTHGIETSTLSIERHINGERIAANGLDTETYMKSLIIFNELLRDINPICFEDLRSQLIHNEATHDQKALQIVLVKDLKVNGERRGGKMIVLSPNKSMILVDIENKMLTEWRNYLRMRLAHELQHFWMENSQRARIIGGGNLTTRLMQSYRTLSNENPQGGYNVDQRIRSFEPTRENILKLHPPGFASDQAKRGPAKEDTADTTGLLFIMTTEMWDNIKSGDGILAKKLGCVNIK